MELQWVREPVVNVRTGRDGKVLSEPGTFPRTVSRDRRRRAARKHAPVPARGAVRSWCNAYRCIDDDHARNPNSTPAGREQLRGRYRTAVV